ncbi:AraC family transcriptional regulator [Oceanispirochaeta crateris]|nr:AraC family transcriptional regulator [Oceanispirochaeta crateris]
MVFPGIENMKEQLIFRSLGDPLKRQRIGCGFMNKKGIHTDQFHSQFSTYALVYVIKGHGYYEIDEGPDKGLKIPLEPGCLFQRFPGVAHSTILDPESDWWECFLDLGEDIFRALVSMRVVIPTEPVYWTPPYSGVEEGIFKILKSLESTLERDLPRISMEILQFCASLLDRVREGDDSLWKRIEMSCQDFTSMIQQRIDLQEYCRSKGWGYESFRKAFVKKMGVSPGQYIIQRRMDEACRLLRAGRFSVKETAMALGYKSPYEFSAQFRRITGWSPRDYRGASRNQALDML